MRKRRKQRIISRNLSLPVWLKLRMGDELKSLVECMIDGAEECHADMMSQSAVFKHRPWKVTLQVKRIYDRKH